MSKLIPRAAALGLLLLAGCVPTATAPPAGPPAPAQTIVGGAVMQPGYTIYQNAKSSRDHSMLMAGVDAAGIGQALSAAGPHTLFAPTDTAFRLLPTGTVEALMHPRSRPELTGLVNYHVVAGAKSRAQIMSDIQAGGGRASYRTAQGQTLRLTMSAGQMRVTDMNDRTANVTQADVTQANGIFHVIDAVLLPAA